VVNKRISKAAGLLDSPEMILGLFSFLLNFVWEFIQVPFYTGMKTMAHWDGTIMCLQATGGDVVITLIAFWFVSVFTGRSWIRRITLRPLLGLVGIGLIITIAVEWVSVEQLGRWTYAPSMPRLPIIGTGLLPLAQWLLIPPVGAWLTSRHLG
jgi:hypothetical protein